MTSVLAYGQRPPTQQQQPPRPAVSMSAVQFLSARASNSSSEIRHGLPTPIGAAGGATCPAGHPIVADPCSGQPICSCQAISGALARGQHQSLGLAGDGGPTSAFYARNESAFGPAAKADILRSMAVGPYPTYSGVDPYAVYPYLNSYAGIDARRKNSMKEATNTLKAWLFEHRKNPYPTKGEKIMLAILTKMTLTQVSTWFANARRRLKKENKVTWGSDKEDDDDDDDDLGRPTGEEGEEDREREREEDKEHYEEDVEDDEDDDIDIGEEDCDTVAERGQRPGQLEVREAGEDVSEEEGSQEEVVCLRAAGVSKATYGAEETGDKSCQPLTGAHRDSVSGQRGPSGQPDSGHQHVRRANSVSDNDRLDTANNAQKPKIWSIADVMGLRDKEETTASSSHPSASSSTSLSTSPSMSTSTSQVVTVNKDRHGVAMQPHMPVAAPSGSGVVVRSSENKLYSLGDAQFAAQLIGGMPLNGTAPYPAIYSQYLQPGISMDGVYPSFLPSAYWRTS